MFLSNSSHSVFCSITLINFSFSFSVFISPIFFSPLCNITAPIKSVDLVFIECNIYNAENLDNFNFIESDSKLIPISLIDNDKKEVIQIVDSDYCFSFPFIFNDDMKEFFNE